MKLKRKQRGIVTILAAISMLVVVAIAGAGIDLGHTFVNKTRAQNLVDALALAGAKSLDETGGNVTAADASIALLFTSNMGLEGNADISSRLEMEDIVVQYSESLSPFVPGGADPQYVRVAIDSIVLQSWFIQLLGIDERNVRASAISGPSSTLKYEICDAAPMMACGDPALPPDPDDPSGQFWGYSPGIVQMLKAGSPNLSERCVGPGNFQLIDIGDGNGAAGVRVQMAGNINTCEDVTDGIETEPGNTVGPSIQGLNTRFNIYSGPMNGTEDDYPPDVLTSAFHQAGTISMPEDSCVGGLTGDLDYNYADYQQDVVAGLFDNPPPPEGGGQFDRRILRIPIGDCSEGSFNGKSTVPYLGLGCFFLLNQVESGGAQTSVIYGEFIENCSQDGAIGPEPDNTPGSYKIILYKDTASIDS